MVATLKIRKDAFQEGSPRKPFYFRYDVRNEGPHNFSYRKFEEADRARVSQILAPEFDPLRKSKGGRESDDDVDRMIAESVAKVKPEHARVLVEDGQVMGIVGSVLHKPDDREFGPLFIDPKFKRKGVGALLTEFLLGELKLSDFKGRVWARTGEDSKKLFTAYFPEAISVTKNPANSFYIIEIDLSKMRVEFV